MQSKGTRRADEAFIIALACGATVENAARSSGIARRTAYKRMADPEFRQRLQSVRAEMVTRAAATLTAAAMEAVKTLLSLQQPSVAAAVRLGAARAVLELGIRLRESGDVEERLVALEKLLATGSPTSPGGPPPLPPPGRPPPRPPEPEDPPTEAAA
jgi:hypothetical protein